MVRDKKYLECLVRELIVNPKETQWLEFKTNYYNEDDIGEYISSLSNSAALADKAFGYMIWGVDDDTHEIIGTKLDITNKKVGNEDFENWLQRLLEPKITFNFYDVMIQDKKVIILEVPRASNTVTKFKNNAFVRVGSYKKKLSENPLIEKELWKVLNMTYFEDGISISNVSSDEVLKMLDYTAYFNLLNIPLPDEKSGIIHYLEEDGLIKKNETGKWDITNFGAILFAKKMTQFSNLARKTVRIIQYKDNSRYDTLREEEIDKGYACAFEEIIKYIQLLTPKTEIIGEVYRKEISMYPQKMIRESVANCIIHQNINITGTGPMVEIFSDRIEITNPGIPLIDKDRFLDNPPKSRNEKIASFLRRINICEERGTGFDKIVTESEKYQLPAPRIDEYKEHTKITLFSYLPYNKMSKEDKLRACYLHACLKYVNNEYLTNSSLRERFKIDVKNSAIISRIIKQAIENGLIKQYEDSVGQKMNKYIPYWA